ncbi:SMC-Scp complex subunit ScpB [Candidatus Woesearchaeota archaeon]|nr:SMC-Scp complex subunit ScpB [Candidatus Woesearchaeota archaeon]
MKKMENTQLSDLKNRLEALLFSSGKPMHLEELSKITKEKDLELIQNALIELKKDIENKKSSIMLIQDGKEWKLAVREHYMPFVRKVVSTTELSKTILQTLAVVAYKAPVLQSNVIKIRTNKAYKHLDFLEEKGYISREKKGRTKLIKLTQKFFEYFDVPANKLKQRFSGFQELEQVIEKKEQDLAKKGIKLEEYDALEVYDVQSKDSKDVLKEMLGGLKIYKSSEKIPEPNKKIENKILNIEKQAEMLKKAIASKKQNISEHTQKSEIKKIPDKTKKKNKKVKKLLEEAKKIKPKKKEYKSKGLFSKGIPPKIQEKIDEKVQDMIEGDEKENDSNSNLS